MAARHGIKLLAPVHDAVLIEAPIERIEADVALMQEIMRRASRIVLNATRRDARAAHRRQDHPATPIATPTAAAMPSGPMCCELLAEYRQGASTMRNGKAPPTERGGAEEADFARRQRRDAEIEAEFQRVVAATEDGRPEETRAAAGRVPVRLPGRRLSVDRRARDLGGGGADLSAHVCLQ